MAPSTTVRASRARRKKLLSAAGGADVHITWFIKQYTDVLFLTMKQRVLLATTLIHSKIIQNISRPVTKSKGSRGKNVVSNRSKPGEYPKADTGILMKSIQSSVRGTKNHPIGLINLPEELDYGFILERWPKLDRNYAARTLNENRAAVMRLLTGPIR